MKAKSETRGRGGRHRRNGLRDDRAEQRERERARARGRETGGGGGGLTSLWRARPAPTAAILSQRPPFSSEREDGRERKSQQHRQRRTIPRGPTATRSVCLSVCLSDCLYLYVSLSPRRTRGRFWDVITAPLLPTRPFLCLSVCLALLARPIARCPIPGAGGGSFPSSRSGPAPCRPSMRPSCAANSRRSGERRSPRPATTNMTDILYVWISNSWESVLTPHMADARWNVHTRCHRVSGPTVDGRNRYLCSCCCTTPRRLMAELQQPF